MNSSTGRWVSDDDFFDRERELQILETRVRDGNHILLTGQRRMGKTSIARELGRRLEAEGWIFLFADVEGAICAEDVIADIAIALTISILFAWDRGTATPVSIVSKVSRRATNYKLRTAWQTRCMTRSALVSLTMCSPFLPVCGITPPCKGETG